MNVSSMQSARVAALYAPTSDELARLLPDVGESLMSAAIELSKSPQPDGCERYIAKLQGAVQLASKLRASLIRESSHTETVSMDSPEPPRAA